MAQRTVPNNTKYKLGGGAPAWMGQDRKTKTAPRGQAGVHKQQVAVVQAAMEDRSVTQGGGGRVPVGLQSIDR